MTTQQESTQEKSLTTRQVANRFFELAEQGHFNQITTELFSQEARSIEPEQAPFNSVDGLEQIVQKAKEWQDITEETHDVYCTEPIVSGNFFACTMGMDVTVQNQGRIKLDEIAIYEVKDGKIVTEQFFY